ncbi:colicin D domain-containing protein [Inquilinus sp. CA228]|uniref:colicin D domain-containing protein n=1 Tax=Inquilinus sp. CA228 TaxID=3455609 RepID=UPI003F8D4B28
MGTNRYAYAFNDPINTSDPTGHQVGSDYAASKLGPDSPSVGGNYNRDLRDGDLEAYHMAARHDFMRTHPGYAGDSIESPIVSPTDIVTGGFAVGVLKGIGRLVGVTVTNEVGGVVGGSVAGGVANVAQSLGAAAAPVVGKVLTFARRPVEKAFRKHGEDFGFTGNFNQKAAQQFEEKVTSFINSPGVQTKTGKYHGQPGYTHHVDPTTGLNVVEGPAGNFVTGFQLGPRQLSDVLNHGVLW